MVLKEFREYLVEWEVCGCVRSFDTWEECKAHLVERLEVRFEPFYVACVRYRKREAVTVWDFEWTDFRMVCREEDKRVFTEQGIWPLVRGIFRMQWVMGG